jgi:hypothetical protein
LPPGDQRPEDFEDNHAEGGVDPDAPKLGTDPFAGSDCGIDDHPTPKGKYPVRRHIANGGEGGCTIFIASGTVAGYAM